MTLATLTAASDVPLGMQPWRGASDYCRRLFAKIEATFKPDDKGSYQIPADFHYDLNSLQCLLAGGAVTPPVGTPAYTMTLAWAEIVRDSKRPTFYVSRVAMEYIKDAAGRDEEYPVTPEVHDKLTALKAALHEVAYRVWPFGDAASTASTVAPGMLTSLRDVLSPELARQVPPDDAPARGCFKCSIARLETTIQALVTEVGHCIDGALLPRIAAVQKVLRTIKADDGIEHDRIVRLDSQGNRVYEPLEGCIESPAPKKMKGRKKKPEPPPARFSIDHWRQGPEVRRMVADFDFWFWYRVGVKLDEKALLEPKDEMEWTEDAEIILQYLSHSRGAKRTRNTIKSAIDRDPTTIRPDIDNLIAFSFVREQKQKGMTTTPLGDETAKERLPIAKEIISKRINNRFRLDPVLMALITP